MKRVHIFCEGQTEETFVREVLQNHLNRQNVSLNPILIRTSTISKGGVVNYAKLRWQVEKKCKEDATSIVTSMIDLYGLPNDFPNKASINKEMDVFQKVLMAEEAFKHDINQDNFIPNLMLHEYEALLFSDVSKFSNWFDNRSVDNLQLELQGAISPEHVNDHPKSAPSKRILRHCHSYDKPLHGSLLAIDIGLDVIRQRCHHFNEWLSGIERLGISG